MALTVKDAKKIQIDTDNAPFSKEEQVIFNNVEKYIDSEIVKQIKISEEVKIDLNIANFNYDPITEKSTTLIERRKNKLSKELKKLYTDAGWRIKIHIDDDLPSLGGNYDYFILTTNTLARANNTASRK
jgi:hypothetical protein